MDSVIKKNKRYRVKEIFYSIQGEGFYSGRPSIFIRFSGCNLWSGLEKDRKKAICKFCDTDFIGVNGENGGEYQINELISKILFLTKKSKCRFVVLTGGEPLLQVDTSLLESLKSSGFYISIETNGTILPPVGIDWITVSPKAGAKLKLDCGDELKLVYPQEDVDPQQYMKLKFNNFYLQPKDENDINSNLKDTLAYCLKNPQWKISLQLHKVLNLK